MQFTTRQNVNEKPACSISKLSLTVSLLAPLLQAAASSSKQQQAAAAQHPVPKIQFVFDFGGRPMLP